MRKKYRVMGGTSTILGLMALLLVRLRENVYVNIAAGMGIAFAYYVALVLGVTAGEKGIIPPAAGAWLANVLFAGLALAGLYWRIRPEFPKRAARAS